MMNRGVMQRQMFSNGGESNLRSAVAEQRLMQKKEDNLSQGAIEYLRVQKDYLIREIEKITGGLTPVDISSLLQRSIPELENFLTQTKEKYQALPSDMLRREESTTDRTGIFKNTCRRTTTDGRITPSNGETRSQHD